MSRDRDQYEFEAQGYRLWPNLLDRQQTGALLEALSPFESKNLGADICRIEQLVPPVAELAHSQTLRKLVEKYLGTPGNPVRAIYFPKSDHNTWSATWHQDRTIGCWASRARPILRIGCSHPRPGVAARHRQCLRRRGAVCA